MENNYQNNLEAGNHEFRETIRKLREGNLAGAKASAHEAMCFYENAASYVSYSKKSGEIEQHGSANGKAEMAKELFFNL